MIRPRLDAPQVTIAEEQAEFKTVTAALCRHPQYPAVDAEHGPFNTLVLAFRPSDEERAHIAAGEDLYVSLLTFGRPMPGIILTVGPDEVAEWYGVAVEP